MEQLKYRPNRKYDDRKPGDVVVGKPRQWWDPSVREKRYAYLKHKSQCAYRREPYDLSWEDWNELWTDELFARRGRGKTDLCLARLRLDEPWCKNNCIIYPRLEHLKRNKEFKKKC